MLQELPGQELRGNKEDLAHIKASADAFSNAYMQADYDGMMDIYCPDARILPPGADIITGRTAIRERWLLPEGVSIDLHKVDPVEIEVSGSTAFDVGYYHGRTKRADNSTVEWRGKYLIVWKKAESGWCMYLDAWNRIE